MEDQKEVEDVALLLQRKEAAEQQNRVMEQQQTQIREQMEALKEGLTLEYRQIMQDKEREQSQATARLEGQLEYLIESQRQQEEEKKRQEER